MKNISTIEIFPRLDPEISPRHHLPSTQVTPERPTKWKTPILVMDKQHRRQDAPAYCTNATGFLISRLGGGTGVAVVVHIPENIPLFLRK